MLNETKYQGKVLTWRVVLILTEEVPRSEDPCRHVIYAGLWDGAIPNKIGQVLAKVACIRVDFDLSRFDVPWHRHLRLKVSVVRVQCEPLSLHRDRT